MNGTSKEPGVVYLVGAGPGDPGLITRTGYDLLQRCDAVAYDALIPMELISALPEHVERHYVGRRAGKHSMPQSEKNRLLVHLAQRGLNVVRLKGGDTSFFGGSAEEAESLAAAGIRVVMVPGVTAASAVAAACSLPLTDRRGASWVFFGTGHGSAAKTFPVPWKEIAGLRGGTVVIYMGLANLEQIVRRLLEGGLAGSTPCMVVQGVTTGVQRILDSTLDAVIADCTSAQLKPPALVIVGEVVRHRTPGKRVPMPLSGKRVLAPCCAQETESVCAVLRHSGAEPLPYPTWTLEHCDDSAAWARFGTFTGSGCCCIFENTLEVSEFLAALLRNGHDLRSLARCRVVCVGAGTEAVLLGKGIRPDAAYPALQAPLRQSSLAGSAEIPCARSLVVFSEEIEIDETEWEEVLRLRLFGRKPAVWEPHWMQEINDNPPDLIFFRNRFEVNGFVEVMGTELALRLAKQCTIIAADEATGFALFSRNIEFSATESKSFLEALQQSKNL